MVSNAEIMAKVEEARQRPNCFELAVIAVESRSPTNAAKKAERRGLSSEDIMYARWIRFTWRNSWVCQASAFFAGSF